MLTSGQLIADRYRLDRRIAVGGMGEVWEAADTRLDRRVAVKVLKPELCGDAEFLHRFRTEARTTASLNHPGIAGVHDYGETAAIPDGPQDTAYLVMELVEGDPLSAILAKHGRISAETTLDILEQAGNALQAAHERGYVHRDVKPGNILVVPGVGGAITVKLTDFGIAKAADAAPVTRSGMVMGTAHYIAPEQALGQEAEPASDVYSLAVVGYECLIGHRPFLSENAVTVAMMHIRDIAPPLPPDVPPGLRALIEATLVKDPRQRYRSGGEFAAAAAAVRAGLPLPLPSGLSAGLTSAGPVPPGNPGGTGSMVLPQLVGSGPGGTMPPMAPVPPPPGVSGSGHFVPATGAMGALPPHQRYRSSRRATAVIVVVVLLIAVVAVGVWAIATAVRGAGAGGGEPSTGGRGQATSGRPVGVLQPTDSNRGGSAPANHTVNVDQVIHSGEDADVAITALQRTGLRTKLATNDENGAAGIAVDPAHCRVTEWAPVGVVVVGTTVTVRCEPDGTTP